MLAWLSLPSGPNAVLRSRHAAVFCQAPATEATSDTCFLFDSPDGRKYVCTDDPEEVCTLFHRTRPWQLLNPKVPTSISR